MRGIFFTFLAGLSLFSAAEAAPHPGLVAPAPECGCATSERDPFEQPVRYAYGSCQGQCLDTCRFRDAALLGERGVRHKKIVVANFLHNHRYWLAAVPENDVSAVDVLFEDFLKGVSHVALRFHFASPFALESQSGAPARASAESLVFSPEGTPPRGQGLDLVQATLGNYILTYRLLSAEEMADWTVRVKGHVVRQYRLKLSAGERARLLQLALRASAERKFANTYALFSNNCATTTVDLVAQVSGKSAPAWQWFARAISLDANLGTLHWLMSAGLVEHLEQASVLELAPPRRQ